MAGSALAKKLGIREGQRLLIINAPEGYVDSLAPLPEYAEVQTTPDGAFDFVQVFVHSRADVEQYARTAIGALKPGGLLWFTYPKKTSKIKTDIHRDLGWDAVTNAGMEGIASVSVDDTWSGIRFRPAGDVKREK
jgi:hypothetical protein